MVAIRAAGRSWRCAAVSANRIAKLLQANGGYVREITGGGNASRVVRRCQKHVPAMTALTPNERVARFRTLFEGREAIYIEKGSLRVKVRNIRVEASNRCVRAEIEEIPTVGFPTGLLCGLKSGKDVLRSGIGSSEDTYFSERTWHAGYPVAFVLYFAPTIVEGLVKLACHFPDSLDPYQRYREVRRYLQDYEAQESTEDLFRKKKR